MSMGWYLEGAEGLNSAAQMYKLESVCFCERRGDMLGPLY